MLVDTEQWNLSASSVAELCSLQTRAWRAVGIISVMNCEYGFVVQMETVICFWAFFQTKFCAATVFHSVNLFSGCVSCSKTKNVSDRDKRVKWKSVCFVETSADVCVDVSFALFKQTIRIQVSYLLSLLLYFIRSRKMLNRVFELTAIASCLVPSE
jgi:hypothetical protein